MLYYSLNRDCRVVKDSGSGKSKGYGFVSFLKKEVCPRTCFCPVPPGFKLHASVFAFFIIVSGKKKLSIVSVLNITCVCRSRGVSGLG